MTAEFVGMSILIQVYFLHQWLNRNRSRWGVPVLLRCAHGLLNLHSRIDLSKREYRID